MRTISSNGNLFCQKFVLTVNTNLVGRSHFPFYLDASDHCTKVIAQLYFCGSGNTSTSETLNIVSSVNKHCFSFGL